MIRNRRRYARQVVTPPLFVLLDGSSNGGVLYDVGEGGLAVDILGSKPAGERVLLEFDMPETGRHFEATGQITWKNEARNRVGLRFVDLSESLSLQVKEWLGTKSISVEFSQNAEFQGLSMEAPPSEHPAPQREKTNEPVALGWFEPVATAQSPDPIYAASRTSFPSDSMPMAPQAPATSALPQGNDDRVVRDLRSALSRSQAARRLEPENEIIPEQTTLDRQRLRKWILVAVLIFLEVLVLAVGVWFYFSQDWNIGAAFERVKAMVARPFSSPPTPPPVSQPSIPKVGRWRPLEESKSQGSKQTTSNAGDQPGDINKTPAPSQFEVLDAQNGRHLLPRTSTNIKIQFERPSTLESNKSSSNEPTLTAPASTEHASLLPPNARGTELGRVSQQSSGELPTLQIMPEYPSLALQKNVQGKVILKAVISKNGTLQNVRLVSPPSPFDSTVLDAVRKWRYPPHYENGEPVEVETEIIMDFSITAK